MINKNLIKGSFILLIAFNLFNLLNFVFHFSMARLLTVAEFGVLSTLYTIIYALSGFSESIQVMMTKSVAIEEDKSKLKGLLNRYLRRSWVISLLLFIAFVFVAILISYLTKIDYVLVLITGFMIFAVFLAPVSRGMLQGRKRFKALGVNMVIESSMKLVLALSFVFIGWKVYGAMIGTVVASLVAIALSFLGLKDITSAKKESVKSKKYYNYTAPSFIIVLSILVFYSLDVFIARIVFSPEISGAYAIASILAKTIFLGTQPISRAMFPLSVETRKDGKKAENVFSNALLILILCIGVALIIFFFFPEFIVWMFSGKEIYESASILIYLSMAIGILSIANLVSLYKLSRGEVRNCKYLVLFVILEIILLSVFSDNLTEFSVAFVVSAVAFLWGTVFLLRD